jgi:hypothetical protein
MAFRDKRISGRQKKPRPPSAALQSFYLEPLDETAAMEMVVRQRGEARE